MKCNVANIQTLCSGIEKYKKFDYPIILTNLYVRNLICSLDLSIMSRNVSVLFKKVVMYKLV